MRAIQKTSATYNDQNVKDVTWYNSTAIFTSINNQRIVLRGHTITGRQFWPTRNTLQYLLPV